MSFLPGIGNGSKKDMPGDAQVPNGFTTKDEQLNGRMLEEKTNYKETAFKGLKYLPPACITPSGLLCGPLLRYCGTYYKEDSAVWKGTILLVLVSEVPEPICEVEGRGIEAEMIFEEKGRKYWRFNVALELTEKEREIRYRVDWDNDDGIESTWWVQGKEDTMRVMFHSCNGMIRAQLIEEFG